MTSAKAANRVQLTVALGLLLFLQFYAAPATVRGALCP